MENDDFLNPHQSKKKPQVATTDSIVRLFQSVRDELEQDESLSGNIKLTIEASFNNHYGEMNVTFSVTRAYNDPAVEGPNFDLVMEEFNRQVAAKKVLKPLYLPRVPDDDVPY